jgi:hypothetical protein
MSGYTKLTIPSDLQMEEEPIAQTAHAANHDGEMLWKTRVGDTPPAKVANLANPGGVGARGDQPESLLCPGFHVLCVVAWTAGRMRGCGAVAGAGRSLRRAPEGSAGPRKTQTPPFQTSRWPLRGRYSTVLPPAGISGGRLAVRQRARYVPLQCQCYQILPRAQWY